MDDLDLDLPSLSPPIGPILPNHRLASDIVMETDFMSTLTQPAAEDGSNGDLDQCPWPEDNNAPAFWMSKCAEFSEDNDIAWASPKPNNNDFNSGDTDGMFTSFCISPSGSGSGAWDSDTDYSHGITSSSLDIQLGPDEGFYIQANKAEQDTDQGRVFDETNDIVRRSQDGTSFSQSPPPLEQVATIVLQNQIYDQSRYPADSCLFAPPLSSMDVEVGILSDMDEDDPELDTITDSFEAIGRAYHVRDQYGCQDSGGYPVPAFELDSEGGFGCDYVEGCTPNDKSYVKEELLDFD
jgi:hypothetical protein